ncbi:MAG: DUF1499 domain-containing protein [Desulfobacteraceae bacterium]
MKKVILLIILLTAGCSNKMEKNHLQEFDFKCPKSPNCVSSLENEESKKVEPIKFDSDPGKALGQIEKILMEMKRCKIILKTDTKIHAVCTSLVFRFRDDLYFEADSEKKIINIKSASRTGYFDFGVNRKRAEKIIEKFYRISNP